MFNLIMDNVFILLIATAFLIFAVQALQPYFKKYDKSPDSGQMLVALYAYTESKKAGKKYPLSVFLEWDKHRIQD